MASVEASHNDPWFGDYDLYVDGTMYERVEVPFPSDVDLLSCTLLTSDEWMPYDCQVDVDGDGSYGYPDYNERMEFCDDSTGTWECIFRSVDPLMDEGNYSLEYEVYDLEPDTNYTAYFNIHVDDFSVGLNSYTYTDLSIDSDSNGEITFDLDETFWDVSNSTCSMNSNFRLVWTSNMSQVLQSTDYASGWCDGDHHITTELDGDEHEMTPQYADNIVDCEMFGANWFCSEDRHENDGIPDYFMRQFPMDRCEEDANGEWTCINHLANPLVWPGDHTVEWIASDLPDSSWRIQTGVMNGSEWINEETYFNGTSWTKDMDFWTDELTCSLQVDYHLYEGEWDAVGSWVEFGQFEDEQYQWWGPCEEGDPIMFFWMDGVEYERTPVNDSFESCTPDGFNFQCWNADWDNDGDGEPDWTAFLDDCQDMGVYWECQYSWSQTPLVWPGDHDLELLITELDEDWSYVLMASIHTWTQGTGSDYEDVEIFFNVSSTGNHTETWEDFEVTESMCNLNFNMNAISGNWNDNGDFERNYTFSVYENFDYQAPCEQPELFHLTYDGVDYEVEYQEEEYDSCEQDGFNFQCWNDEWDNDGDGEPDWTNHMNDCEEDSSGMYWTCVQEWNYDEPEIEAGNHTMELTIEVEEYESYAVTVLVDKCQNNGGCDSYEEEFAFNATSDTETVTFYVETDNYTCDLNLNINRRTIEWDDNGNWYENNWIWEYFRFDAPCEEPPSPFTLTADGVEWEPVMNYYYYDYCDESEEPGYYYCWNESWTDDDGDPHWTDHMDDCVDMGFEWQCEGYEQNPYIEAANHTMELSVEGLEPGENYGLEIDWDVCGGRAGCDWNEEWLDFNATSDAETFTFYVETDNYTCGVSIYVYLVHMDENGNHHGGPSDSFHYSGPCNEPPSPFTLTYDGIEWEKDWNYETYDYCEEDQGDFICSQDGSDGEWWHNDCEEDTSDGTWICQTWWQPPWIEEGNHTMVLSIEDLEVGTNYSVEWSFDICQAMIGCDGVWDEFDFNATAETMSETFYIETDNFTCQVYINVGLYVLNEDGWKDYEGDDYFTFGGPCEEPPSPFTLTYDGFEYESSHETIEFDYCDEDGPMMVCWQEMWDFDGDGYPEHDRYMDDCEDMGTHWECESPWEIYPEIEEGNYTMLLSVEDLVVGNNYSMSYDWSYYGNQDSDYGYDSMDFTATAETMSETFHVEFPESMCNLHISVSLYETTEGWDRIASDHYSFNGPCGHDSGPIALEYDDGSGPVEWEMAEEATHFDYCWADGPNHYMCMDEGDEYMSYENNCNAEESVDGGFDCHYMTEPKLEEAADLDMVWTLEADDLEVGDNYTLIWYYCIEDMMGDGGCSDDDGWGEIANFTGSSSGFSADWELSIENSTCYVDIVWDFVLWGDQEIDFENGEPMDYMNGQKPIRGPCQWEWPVDVTLQVDDNGWQDVPGIDIMSLMDDEDEDESDAMMMQLIMENNYHLSEGNWSMQWTMDGLEENHTYMIQWESDGPESGQTFICGNGDEIPFEWVNDEESDCMDGADEQQYDDNGDPINWFDCNDGSEVWVYQVNDGNADCPDGEDEASGPHIDWSSEEEFFADSTTMTILAEDLEVPSDFCVMMIMGSLYDLDYGQEAGMFVGFIVGDLWEDEDGDGWPDCVPMDDDDYQEGPAWEVFDFATGQSHEAILEMVDDASASAALWIAQHTTLHDDLRLKIDADFFDGDGVLNDTEAMEFEMMYAYGFSGSADQDGDGCDDFFPPFTINGVQAWCAEPHLAFHNLANNTVGDSPALTTGWILHYNVTVDEDGEMNLYFPGDENTVLGINGTICGGALDTVGLVPVSWSYDNVTQTGLCVDVMAGDTLQSIEVVFGFPDSDGDGYNDFDDRFPEDPEEWADSDDDGVGDNHDEFPNDATEWNDADGDGVGDNGDAFPWDASESADSDGDGWGDNSDAFPDDATEWVDTDEDGIGDNADTDADGDGTDDTDEDSDGDGVNDDEDAFPFDANESLDSDGDGVGDNGDAFPNDANESTDTDGDGLGDNSDDDADGDGTPNDLDDFPLNSEESTDSDGDGVGDSEDAFPNDPTEYFDNDGDGIGDNADTDDDNDDVPDTSDAFPLDPNESSDTDGDGYGDNSDAFPNDAGEWSDYDGDGVGDNSDAFMSDPYESRDSDGDGTGDNADWAPNDPSEKVDTDGDGVGNNADAFPNDASESKDTDGDGIGDNADDDADGDGIPDDGVVDPDDTDSGGILPGFTAITGLASVLGAAILVAGRRKD